MKTLYILLLFVTSANMSVFASDDAEGYAVKHHQAAMTGELTSATTWQLELSYHWFPIKYVGIGASVGCWKQIEYDQSPATNEWRLSEDSRSMSNLFFMPSIMLVSPAIIRTEYVDIGIMAEPGFMMNVAYDKVVIENTYGTVIPQDYKEVSCNNGKWYAFNFRIGVYAIFDPICISLGYAYSDLDIYAMRRNMQYKNIRIGDFYPNPKSTNAFFLRISYSF